MSYVALLWVITKSVLQCDMSHIWIEILIFLICKWLTCLFLHIRILTPRLQDSIKNQIPWLECWLNLCACSMTTVLKTTQSVSVSNTYTDWTLYVTQLFIKIKIFLWYGTLSYFNTTSTNYLSVLSFWHSLLENLNQDLTGICNQVNFNISNPFLMQFRNIVR